MVSRTAIISAVPVYLTRVCFYLCLFCRK